MFQEEWDCKPNVNSKDGTRTIQFTIDQITPIHHEKNIRISFQDKSAAPKPKILPSGKPTWPWKIAGIIFIAESTIISS